MVDKTTIGIGLISHTNIGKTSLARTLLRKDIGEVDDAAHVTLDSTGYTFIENQRAHVMLWDTPGFGGTVSGKLVSRLRSNSNPLSWLMHQVVDKLADKPLYSSVEAAKTLATRCDVILYLVNALDHPDDATYVQSELDLIQLMNVPAIIILNQITEEDRSTKDQLIDLWQSRYGDHPAVRNVIAFDAFSRFWFEEVRVLKAVVATLDQAKHDSFSELIELHQLRQIEIEKGASKLISESLEFAVNQKLSKAAWPDGKKALKKMLGDLQQEIQTFIDRLAQLYSLSVDDTPGLQADLEHLEGLGEGQLPELKTGLLTGAISGAGYGLAADLAAGGLSFGGGALVGFILGGFGGLVAAKGINAVLAGGKNYNWKTSFLFELVKQLFVIYLVVAHHGRGKGRLDFKAESNRWFNSIDTILETDKSRFEQLLEKRPLHTSATEELINRSLLEILADLYPDFQS